MRSKKTLWGLFFILIGVVIIVNKLGYLYVGNLFSFIITLLLIPIFVKGIINIKFPSIILPIAVVLILYADELEITALSPWPILIAAVCSSIGLSLIFGKCHFCHHKHKEIISNDNNDDFDIDSNFNSVIKYIDTENLKGGMIDCSFGSAKVYFDKASLNKKGATIKFDVSFSGIELYVPKEWKVINKINVFAGGVDEKGIPTRSSDNSLTLIGNINFSGITIIYV